MRRKVEKPEPDSPKPFNPLAKRQLAQSIAEALLISDLSPLPPSIRFPGAGIYAIYYSGAAPRYRKLIEKNAASESLAPIYVGKAIPFGGRKGGMDFDSAPGYSLFSRLSEHADSINETADLEIGDFRCRYLVVDDIWIPLGESLLIDRFRPLWNVLIDGFGNHAPGAGRYQQKKSPWDALHPGRRWAEKLQPPAKTVEIIESEIAAFFERGD
jgi:hypothetical protein